MNTINVVDFNNIIIEETGGSFYVSDKIFESDEMADLEYVTELLKKFMRSKCNIDSDVDAVLINEIKIVFPQRYVEAAHILMAISIFKSFRDQGLLTEEEYREITRDEEKRWRNLLYGDSMVTNRVVSKEGVNE